MEEPQQLQPEVLASWQKRLGKAANRFDENAGLFKSLEAQTGLQSNAYLMEVRYFAQEFVTAWKFLNNGLRLDVDEVERTLANAEVALMNARHDITDGQYRHFAEKLDLLVETHGEANARLLKSVTEALELKESVAGFQSLSRAERHKRPEIYVRLREEYLPKMVHAIHSLTDANTLLERNNRVQQRQNLINLASLLLGMAGFLVGVASLV